MKQFNKQATSLLLAAGMGLAATAWAADTLQDVLKARGLSQQDLLAAAKTYVPTGKRDEFVAFSSGGQSGQVIVYAFPRCASSSTSAYSRRSPGRAMASTKARRTC
jgi:nitrous-oxide reductase